MSWASIARFCVLALLAGCAAIEDDAAVPARHPSPEASLRAPVIGAAGTSITLDASASKDKSGTMLTYVFEFGDGTPRLRSTEAAAQHIFAHEGLYTIAVRVLDATGGEALAVQDIAIRKSYPDPPDFCSKASDCLMGDECEAGVCYSIGGAVE